MICSLGNVDGHVVLPLAIITSSSLLLLEDEEENKELHVLTSICTSIIPFSNSPPPLLLLPLPPEEEEDEESKSNMPLELVSQYIYPWIDWDDTCCCCSSNNNNNDRIKRTLWIDCREEESLRPFIVFFFECLIGWGEAEGLGDIILSSS